MFRWQWRRRHLTRPAIVATLCLLAAAASACASPTASSASGKAITVAAASDLQVAFPEIGRLFEQETGTKAVFSFGSSGNLATQIENGAPIDLFASADEGYVQQLVAKGLASQDKVQLYGLGRLALVTFKKSNLLILHLEDLLSPEVKHVSIANPDHAPYGVAAKQALTSAGIWDQLKPKVVYGENVSQALQFVQTGNADAGIVALSISDVAEVTRAPIDDSLYAPLRQAMVVLKGSSQQQLAGDFASFINGPKGRPIMDKYGFSLPGVK
jgi:molybdate transport system substrate-binding protein